MSMLTPPGMGGKYRITGDSYPRMRRPRRRRRIVVTTLAVTAGLGVLSWGTVQLVDVFTGGGTSVRAAGEGRACERDDAAEAQSAKAPAASGKPSGKPAPGALPEPSAITVNVYNATTRSGLAKNTADALKKRGFKVGEVANAPASLDKKVKEAGLLMGPPAAHRTGAFDVLHAQLPQARIREVDRKGREIDLVIGKAFKGLAKEKDVREAMAALASPSPSPSPSGC
ncbi:LytR C-terminal domain-containing protein [Streptomyces glaucosporus]|uniref:LytR C-terminal domain-containing protein n=1 Tax=Streptomyces glaucosporus TaxID=284044 RepID=A0ABN3HLI0_9ACTN